MRMMQLLCAFGMRSNELAGMRQKNSWEELASCLAYILLFILSNCLSMVSLKSEVCNTKQRLRSHPALTFLFPLLREICISHVAFFSAPLQGLLFVSSNSGLVEVPVANCSNYLSCGECVLSRDPYCAWTGRLCRDVRMAPPDRWETSHTDTPTLVAFLWWDA